MGNAREPQWYFDFISPFAYLQFHSLDALAPPAPRLRPVLFAGLLKHWGHLGPAEIPAKRRFTYRHSLWRARDAGVTLRFPPAHPFNPLPVLRLAIALGSTRAVVGTLFDAIWRDGRDPDGEWDALCEALEIAPAEARARIGADDVKAELRANTEAAIAAGVFGVPTLSVDGELFWGDDATRMAGDWLRDRDAFEDAEMRRVSQLPAAVERPRP